MYPRFSSLTRWLVLAVLCLAGSLASSAELAIRPVAVTPMTLGELVAGSDHVVLGIVQDVQPRWNATRTSIVTDVSVTTSEYFKSTTFKPQLLLTLPGGTVEGLTVKVEDVPGFGTGDTVLLFLREQPTSGLQLVGLSQGVYYVRGPRAVHAPTGVATPLADLRAQLRSLVGVPPPAYGGALILRKTPEQLTLEAESVVVGGVEDVQARFTASLESIETVVTVRVEQAVTGTPPARITLVLAGGAIGDLRVMVGGVPNFWPGERVLLFLRGVHGAPTVAGAWQGKYSLVGNVAIQPESGDRLTLAALGSRIAQAIATPAVVADDDTPTVSSAPFTTFCAPWTTTQVPVPHFVNPAAAGLGAPTGTAFVKLVQQALQPWQDNPSAWFSARIAGTTTRPGTNNFDGLKDVAWSNLDSLGGGVLGVNTCVFNSAGRFDSDTLFDNTGTFWSTTAAPGTIDLDSVARHEFGHGLGLGHSNAVPCDAFPSTPLMCPFITTGVNKTILADDSNGLISLYPLVGGPPLAPSGLVATQASDTTVALQWNEVGNELAYEVQRASGGCGGPFQAINSVPANSPVYTDTDLGGGLPPGTYCYRVKALGRGGDSGFSNAAPVSVIVVFTGGVFVAAGDVDGLAGAEIVTGPGPGAIPHVRIFKPNGTTVGGGYLPFAASPGGVRVAACDFDGDGRADVVAAAGPGGGPHVVVTKLGPAGNVVATLASFFAYGAGFTGGVWVACGDVDGDMVPEIITGADAGGGPHVRVLRLQAGVVSALFDFFPYPPGFTGGVRVAAGDVDGSGRASVITGAGQGGGPHVRAIKLVTSGGAVVGTTDLASFFAYNPGFIGGVFVAAGDVAGGGVARIVTGAGAGGGPHVRVFTGSGVAVGGGFFAYTPTFTGGVRIAAGDLDAAGPDEIVTAPGAGGGPHVRAFSSSGVPTATSFFAY